MCVTHSFQCGCICDGTVHKDIIMDFVSLLSCSMTSGKSGLWCDANLSCLRISTPQKPWSPTAELKTCWLLTMDSRTLYLPASGSAAPSTIHHYGHPFCPGVRGTLMSHAGPSIHVSDHKFTRNPHMSFILGATSPHISAFSGVLLYFVSASSPRSVCVLSCHFFLTLPVTLCAHCQCGIWEHGLLNTGSFIPSWKCVLNWLDNVGYDWHCLRLICWCLFGFLFCQREQNLTPIVQMKESSCHSVVQFLFSFARS